jgi:hypothetical protein
METVEDTSTYRRYVFLLDEFIEKLGLPADANVISVEFNWYTRQAAVVVPVKR